MTDSNITYTVRKVKDQFVIVNGSVHPKNEPTWEIVSSMNTRTCVCSDEHVANFVCTALTEYIKSLV